MKRPLSFTCFLLLFSMTFGQSRLDVQMVLAQNDYGEFISFLENKEIVYEVELGRDILVPYHVKQIFVPQIKNLDHGVFEEIRFDLILKDNQIIYCKTHFEWINEEPVCQLDPCLVEAFLQKYQEKYRYALSFEECFEPEVKYGFQCGYGGINPPYRDELEKAVMTHNTFVLDQWLRSPIFGLNVYAVEGFDRLSLWYTPTWEQRQLIEEIFRREDVIEICSGCLSWTQRICEFWANNENGVFMIPLGLMKESEESTYSNSNCFSLGCVVLPPVRGWWELRDSLLDGICYQWEVLNWEY